MRRNRIAVLIGALFCLAWAPRPAAALTLADVLTQARRYLRDTASDTTLQRYSDTYLTDLANAGQRAVVSETWPLNASTTLTLSVGTTYYSLPTDMLGIREVTYQNGTTLVRRNLTETSERSIMQSNSDYERQSGEPTQYFTRPSTASATTLEMAILPVPRTSSSTGTVRVDYYNQATNLSTATTSGVPFDGDRMLYPYHEAIVYYVIWRVKLLEGDTAGAAGYQQLYESAVTVMGGRLGDRPNYTPGFKAATK
jgi:hypothetical protein